MAFCYSTTIIIQNINIYKPSLPISRMANVNTELLTKLVDAGFFDDWKSIEEVVDRLDQKGFSVKGKQVSLLSQLLTFLCQKDIIEREKDEKERWKYKKIGGRQNGQQ